MEVIEDDEKADGEVLVATRLTEEEVADQIKDKEFDMGDTAAPRRFKITKKMLLDHGFSARCEGCRVALDRNLHKTTVRKVASAIWNLLVARTHLKWKHNERDLTRS